MVLIFTEGSGETINDRYNQKVYGKSEGDECYGKKKKYKGDRGWGAKGSRKGQVAISIAFAYKTSSMMVKSMDARARSGFLCTSCVTLHKLLNLSVPQMLHL